jgi:hypothetical protein
MAFTQYKTLADVLKSIERVWKAITRHVYDV